MRKKLTDRPSRAALARTLRLLAAAPDLLALAEDISHIDPHTLAHSKGLLRFLREWKKAARAAIAKAEGK